MSLSNLAVVWSSSTQVNAGAQHAGFASLTEGERAAAHALVDESISELAASQRFGPAARAQGETTVSLDAEGNLIEVGPDGEVTDLREQGCVTDVCCSGHRPRITPLEALEPAGRPHGHDRPHMGPTWAPCGAHPNPTEGRRWAPLGWPLREE